MYNYKFSPWTEEKEISLTNRAEKLKPGKFSSFVFEDVICPRDKDADEGYYASIIMWQNEDMSYSIGFFFGYYLDDAFFEKVIEVPYEKKTIIKDVISQMHKDYCNTDTVDKIIDEWKAKKMYYRYEARHIGYEESEWEGIFSCFTPYELRKWYCLTVPKGMRKIQTWKVRHGLRSMGMINGTLRWKKS